MNLPLHRNTYENAINKESTNLIIVAKNKMEPKFPFISYNYEAAISQPDIPIRSKVDNNTSWSEPIDELSAPTTTRNLYACGKANVTVKRRGITFKSKTQVKKFTKNRPLLLSCNIDKIKEKSIPSSEIQDVKNFEKENSYDVTLNRRLSFNSHQVRSNKIFSLDLLNLKLICIIFKRI
ncbi:hypothetical protein P5V15_012348 [Pogonomyrmex californicus]